MDQSDDPQELARKIEQATRIVSHVNDQTTVERLRAWIEDLKQKLRQRLEARRTRQAISARAQELWEQNGRPSGRDVDFWLKAESEVNKRVREWPIVSFVVWHKLDMPKSAVGCTLLRLTAKVEYLSCPTTSCIARSSLSLV